MTDEGKNVVFDALGEALRAESGSYRVTTVKIKSREEMESLVRLMCETSAPSVYVVDLALSEDVSDLFAEIDAVRETLQMKFICITLAYLKSVYAALEKRNKSLTRSMFVLTHLDFDDTLRLIANFSERYAFSLTLEQSKEIYEWSRGHDGLIKSLYLLRKDYPQADWSLSYLLEQDSLLLRLESILTDLPEDKVAVLASGSGSYLDRLFLEKFGFTCDGVIFNPLLSRYLVLKGYSVAENKIVQELTGQEGDIFRYLTLHAGELISRSALAGVVWGDGWKDKYSDDALDQLIHRLREKIKISHAPFVLTTKKGQGIILQATG